MSQTVQTAQEGRQSLLTHFGVMLALCVSLQVAIAIRGNRIDLVSDLMLAAVALYYAYYQFFSGRQLRRLRFGRLVAHVVGFLIVNLSFHVHALVLFVSNSNAIRGTDSFGINPGWFGVLFGMTTFWGLGLLVHLVASIANRGFEELPRG